MALARRFSGSAGDEERRLQRKWDQHSEMMCLALNDGDAVDAAHHKREMDRLREELRELRAL